LVLGLSLLSLLYAVKLRDIPYLKIYLIAASWCFSTILLTVLENKLIVDLEIILSMIGRFFFIVAITIPFDIRDVNFDKKRLKTLPILFGVERSKKIALIMLLLFLILEFFHYVVFSWEINFFLASLLCFGYTYYLIKKSGMDRNRFYYSFWVESCSISLVVFLIITAIFL
jgi:4-hydroxybenzoate polyprenyltransferase